MDINEMTHVDTNYDSDQEGARGPDRGRMRGKSPDITR